MKLNAISVLARVCTRLIIYFETQKGNLTLLSSSQNDLFNTEYLDKAKEFFLLSFLPSLLSSFFLFLLPSSAPGAHEDAAGFQNGAPRDGPDGSPDGRASGKVGGRHGALRALLQPRALLSFRVFRPLPRTAGHFRKGTGLTSLCLPVLPFAVRPLLAGRLSSAASGAGWGSGGVPQGS